MKERTVCVNELKRQRSRPWFGWIEKAYYPALDVRVQPDRVERGANSGELAEELA
jgi:hypothetical protein